MSIIMNLVNMPFGKCIPIPAYSIRGRRTGVVLNGMSRALGDASSSSIRLSNKKSLHQPFKSNTRHPEHLAWFKHNLIVDNEGNIFGRFDDKFSLITIGPRCESTIKERQLPKMIGRMM